MTRLIALLTLCGAALAADVYRVRIPALNIDTTVEVERVEPEPPPPDPEPPPPGPTPDPEPDPEPEPSDDLFAAQRPIWARMVTENHPWYVFAKGQADTWGEKSQFSVPLFLMTGEDKYLQAAFNFSFYPSREATNLGWNHISHSSFIDTAILYHQMRGRLTPEQDALARRRLTETAEFCRTARTSDSDATLAAYYGAALTDAVLGTSYLSDPKVGGLHYDASKGPYETQRNAVYHYAAVWGKGGQWPESEMYNLASVTLLSLAHDKLKRLHGTDHYPEAAAFLSEARIALTISLTPDLKRVYQWGDEQNPGDLRLLGRYAQLASVGAHDFVAKVAAANASGGKPWHSWFYFADPYSTTQTPQPFSHFAEGHGLWYAKTADSLFAGRFSPAWVVDHNLTFVQGDFSLYHKGGWAVGRPETYGGAEDLLNAMTFAGISGFSTKPPVKRWEGAGWYAVRGGDYGRVEQHTHAFPPDMLPERTRTLVFLAGTPTVIVRDKFTVRDPLKLGGVEKYAAALDWNYLFLKVLETPQAGQIVTATPPAKFNQPVYLHFAGKLAKVSKVEAVAGRPDVALVAFDASQGSPKAGDPINYLGGGKFAAVMQAKELARWQLHVPPGATFRADGCDYSVAGYPVSVTRYGGGTSSLEPTPSMANSEHKRFPQRYLTTLGFAEAGTHDWVHVIRVGHADPVTVSGDEVRVGSRMVRLGDSVSVEN